MSDEERDVQQRSRREKRPYRSPAIDDTAVFETLALTCTKESTSSTCNYAGNTPTQS